MQNTPASEAKAFRESHTAYFFEDAHFLVEASAKAEATELQRNVFQFSDGSVLAIDNAAMRVTDHADLEAFKATLPLATV